jgi:hypothetical protein
MNNNHDENNKKQDKVERFIEKLLELNEKKFPNDKETKDNVLLKIMDHLFEKSEKSEISTEAANKFANSVIKRYDSLEQATKNDIKSVFAATYAQYNIKSALNSNDDQAKQKYKNFNKSHPRINEASSEMIVK